MTAPAFHFEAKKHAYRQTQDGIVVSFVVHPNDVCADLAIAPLGTQYIVALAPYTEAASPSSNGRTPDSDSGDRGSSPRGETSPSSSNGRTADFESADRGSNPRDGSKSPAPSPEKVKERKPFHTLPRSQQAAILINDASFQWWVGSNRNAAETDRMIKAHMGIASKRDLDQDIYAQKWDRMVEEFRASSGRVTWERPA